MMISERTDGPIDGAPVRLYPLDGAKNVGDDWIEVNTIADGTFVITIQTSFWWPAITSSKPPDSPTPAA